jgi:hypothetical protein
MRVQKQAAGLDPRFREIPCPVLRTLANEQRIDVGPEGQVDMEQLKKALRGIGASELVSQVLVRGGHSAAPVKPELLRDQGKKELDFFRLRGSTLDHKGDSQVLRDPSTTFSPERLAGLLALSSDGKTLTLADLAAANKRFVAEEDGSLRDTVFGVAELAALLLVFGKRREDGVKALENEDVVSLFRDAKIPAGFEPGDVGLTDVVGAMAKMAFHRMFTTSGRAVAGLELATDKPRLLDQTSAEGLRSALCPAGMRPKASPATSQAEVAQLHAPKTQETRAE